MCNKLKNAVMYTAPGISNFYKYTIGLELTYKLDQISNIYIISVVYFSVIHEQYHLFAKLYKIYSSRWRCQLLCVSARSNISIQKFRKIVVYMKQYNI